MSSVFSSIIFNGVQIAYSSLSGLPTLGTAAATASTDYAVAAKGVTNGDSHNHLDGDGAQIAYSSLSGTPSLSGYALTTDLNTEIDNRILYDQQLLEGIAYATDLASHSVGTVTSVGLSLPTEFTLTNSPVTSSGTLTVTKASQTAKYVYAAPNANDGAPSFRLLVASDVPTLNQNTTGTAANVTGTVAIANGGTGTTTAQLAINALAGAVTSGYYPRGNGTNVVMNSIQAGDVPTLNQNTTGTAANVTGTVAIANGGTGATIAATALSNLGGEPADANIAKVNSAKTWTATQTFNGIEINDTSDDHQYILAVSELTADRTVTLPLLTENDTFVFASHTQTLTGKTITGLKETKVASSSYNFDLSLGNYFTHTASANNLTVSNVPATGTVGSFIIELTNGGAYTFTFWSGVKWAGGTAPTFTVSGVDILGFYTHDGGTTWRGLLLAKDSK